MLQVVDTKALLHTRPRLLLVDDNTQQLELSAYILKVEGYSVVTAANPNTAITLAKRQRPDLMIVDYTMPVMNGCMLADRLRIIMPKLHIILYSGSLDIPDSDILKVSAFVSKSDGLHVLLRHVAQLLRSPNEPGQKAPRENSMRKYGPQHL
jgi:CheY-like chemotaxis protein